MLSSLLQTSYFALFLIIALGFILGRIKIKGLSLDVSAVIFIALLFGHFGVTIPKELGNIGLVLFIFTIGIQAGPGFFDSFRSKGKTLIILALLIVGSASLTGIICKYAFGFIGTTYLYHSIIYDKTGTYLLENKGVLGKKASDGCIRFSVEHAKWFYDNMISGTTVYIS